MIRKRRYTRIADSSSSAEGMEIIQSSSDMFIGLLFIFLIMIVVLATQQREIFKQALPTSKLQGDPTEVLIGDLGTRLKAAGVNVVADPKSGTLTLPSDALFEFGKSELSSAGSQAAAKVASILSKEIVCFVSSEVNTTPDICPEDARLFEIETIFVEGHTDDKPLNRGPYNNWHLALDRARSVSSVLSSDKLGSYKNARQQSVIAFSSYADQRPVDRSKPDLNRRVELRFVTSSKAHEKILKARTVGELIDSALGRQEQKNVP